MIKQALIAPLLISTFLPPQAFAEDIAGDGSRPDDAPLTCEALTAERDSIEKAEAKLVKRAQTGKKALSFAGHVLSAASPGLAGYTKSGATAMVAQGVIGAVSANTQNTSDQPSKTDQPTAAALRLARVKALISDKAC